VILSTTACAKPVGHLCQAEYVAAEAAAAVDRHEYLRSDIYAMAGETFEHAALDAALAREVQMALGGKPCCAFLSDARVRIEVTDLTTYPDPNAVRGEGTNSRA
jgi:Putative restriction endonuclease